MRHTQAWFQRLPLPLFFFSTFALWVAVHLVLAVDRIDLIRVIGDVVGGLIFAAVSTAFVAVRRRRLGGREQVIEYLAAVRAGRLPAHVDAVRWRDALDRDHRAAARARWTFPLAVAVPVVLSIVLIALDPHHPLAAVLLLVLFAGLGVVGSVTSARRRRRLESLSAQLDRQAAGHPAT